MKKIFENPTMEISLFCTENIVTVSATQANVEEAKKALSAAAGNITEVAFGDIVFTP